MWALNSLNFGELLVTLSIVRHAYKCSDVIRVFGLLSVRRGRWITKALSYRRQLKEMLESHTLRGPLDRVNHSNWSHSLGPVTDILPRSFSHDHRKTSRVWNAMFARTLCNRKWHYLRNPERYILQAGLFILDSVLFPKTLTSFQRYVLTGQRMRWELHRDWLV
jgi:hypothetical protein